MPTDTATPLLAPGARVRILWPTSPFNGRGATVLEVREGRVPVVRIEIDGSGRTWLGAGWLGRWAEPETGTP